MKTFLIGITIFFVFSTFTIFQYDYNLHQQYTYNLKFAAIETAAAAAQYINEEEYGEGKLVFNQVEGIEAASYILQKQLKLDEFLIPTMDSYWSGKIKFKVEFYDDSNNVFPFLYTNDNETFALVITEPTVVVTINAGKPKYRFFQNLPDSIRIAAQSWDGY